MRNAEKYLCQSQASPNPKPLSLLIMQAVLEHNSFRRDITNRYIMFNLNTVCKHGGADGEGSCWSMRLQE